MKILKQNNTNIWFIVALEDEFYNKEANIIYTGIGKVNAAMATQYLLDHFKVEKLINIGTAGASSKLKKDHIYEIGIFIQRNIWTNDLARKERNVVKSSTWNLFDYNTSEKFNISEYFDAISTGDDFVNDIDNSECKIVDMESFAIAYVCRENNMLDNFYCLKYISDNGCDDDWELGVKKCNKMFNKIYKVLENVF